MLREDSGSSGGVGHAELGFMAFGLMGGSDVPPDAVLVLALRCDASSVPLPECMGIQKEGPASPKNVGIVGTVSAVVGRSIMCAVSSRGTQRR